MTTDGIKRKSTHAKPHAKHVDAKQPPKVEAPVDTHKGVATATRGLDALDDAKGTSTASKGQQGVNGALTGLAALAPKKRTWRAAVTGALVGLSLATSFAPSQHHHAVRTHQTHTLVEEQRQPPFATRIVAPSTTTTSTTTTSTTSTTSTTPATPRTVAIGESVAAAGVRGDLPETLTRLRAGTLVQHGTDPGDFYCEHAFYTTTRAALQPGSSILRNAAGEVMTGFLHVPADSFTYSGDPANTKVQAERHAERREVIGGAIRGFYEDARSQIGDGAFRMMVTGYMQWGGVIDNPTGDFTGHTENIDAAMASAFGDVLLTAQGRTVDTERDPAGMTRVQLEYKIKDAKTASGERTILVDAVQLPVSDDAINGGPSSLQAVINAAKPHAVVSMGVNGGSSSYLAEFHADDGGLRVDADGKVHHDDNKTPEKNHPDNYALARAIRRGRSRFDDEPATSVVVAGAGPSPGGGG